LTARGRGPARPALRGQRALVTGAGGFIGVRLVRALIEEGAAVFAALRKGSEPPAALAHVSGPLRFFELDVRDAAACRAALRPLAPEVVYHLAAFTDNRREPGAIDEAVATNVAGTANVVRALEGAPLRSFVHAGTGEEYGRGPVPFREDQPLDPVSPYSASKAAVAHVLRAIHVTNGFPSVTARIFMPYGPGMAPHRFLALALTAARTGETLRMTRGAQTRDFVHVDDVVEALIRVSLSREVFGEAVNVGTGVETSLRDAAALVGTLTDGRLRVEAGAVPYRKAEVMRSVADVAHLKERIGWVPRISLEEGLRRLLADDASRPAEREGR